MLLYLDEPAKTVVAVAALTGLRLSELRGLRWGDYDGANLYVHRSVWRTHVSGTKTAEAEAAVPVLPVLKDVFDRHRKDASDDAYIFAGERRGAPLNLANLARRVIIPKFKAVATETGGGVALSWKGWHAFRRGLATNLFELKVPPRIVQGILRHASLTTTMQHYIQANDPQMREAVQKLGEILAPLGV